MGRPKKITPEISHDIIYLHIHGLTLRSIATYIFCSRHITLSRTAIKYTIDEFKSHMKQVFNVKIVTPEEPTTHRIKMVTPAESKEKYGQLGQNKTSADNNTHQEDKT